MESFRRNHRHALDFYYQGRVGKPLYPDQCAGRQVGFKILAPLVVHAMVFIHVTLFFAFDW